jgi:membrane fusion protein (multidrug efflux system)
VRTLVVYLLALAAIATAAAFALPELIGVRGDAAPVGADSAPPPVVVAVAVEAPFAETMEALGTILANESVVITASRADLVAALHFDDGQDVEAGQLLAELHSEEEVAQLAEAAAMRDERHLTFQRLSELSDKQMASQRELDNARALLSAAEARVQQLQAAIDDRQIRAPFAGTLGLRRVSVGAYVGPSTVLTTLDDLAQVKLDFTIPETWLANVRTGMAVTARSDAWPKALFTGTVTTIGTRLDPGTRSATVRALVANTDRRLRPGMLAKVRVERGEEPVLQVPEAAVVLEGDRAFVFRVDAGDVARRVPIEVGRRRVGAVEVHNGLAAGDRVVVEGLVRVRADAPVRPVATREIGS